MFLLFSDDDNGDDEEDGDETPGWYFYSAPSVCFNVGILKKLKTTRLTAQTGIRTEIEINLSPYVIINSTPPFGLSVSLSVSLSDSR